MGTICKVVLSNKPHGRKASHWLRKMVCWRKFGSHLSFQKEQFDAVVFHFSNCVKWKEFKLLCVKKCKIHLKTFKDPNKIKRSVFFDPFFVGKWIWKVWKSFQTSQKGNLKSLDAVSKLVILAKFLSWKVTNLVFKRSVPSLNGVSNSNSYVVCT